MQNLDDPVAVEFVYILQPLPDARGKVLLDTTVGGHLRCIFILYQAGNLSLLYKMVLTPGSERLTLPQDSRELFREQIIPDWRRVELRSRLDFPGELGLLQRWNMKILSKVLLEVATACVDLGYHPLYYRKGPDLVWELEPSYEAGVVPVKEITLEARHLRRTRLTKFQLERSPEVHAAMQRICTSYGLPPQMLPWLVHIFYHGPDDELARHFLALMGQVSGGPLFSFALRLNPQQWGFTIYQPGNWLVARIADLLIPAIYDFLIAGNIRLFRSTGFEALGPWLTRLRSTESVVAPDGRKFRTSATSHLSDRHWRWAIRVSGTVIQESPGWVAPEALGYLLQAKGDFLLAGNLCYLGATQLRTTGSALRQVWEREVGQDQYLIEASRPRTLRTPDQKLLRALASGLSLLN
jgi:hypothetical protein